MTTRPTNDAIAQFIYNEAALVDAGRYDEWLDLFADEAIYWLPLSAKQSDYRGEQSIACEDKMLLNVRIKRLKGPRAYSNQPPARCLHVLQAPAIEEADTKLNRFITRAPFFYVESRGDAQFFLAGRVLHRLRVENGVLRIVEKRVDLINADAALPPIFLFP
ncbi:MAG: phenylpropionate dioxygenase [Betaproteobacteria bacterium]|nr:phenylpropionate dioxygenase [Betaproteobacteria bacterium]